MNKEKVLEKNITSVEAAYCHYFPVEVRNHIALVASENPYDPDKTRNLILDAIKPAADTRKKLFFVNKIKSMKNPITMVYYLFNSYLKALETPDYDYSYYYKKAGK